MDISHAARAIIVTRRAVFPGRLRMSRRPACALSSAVEPCIADVDMVAARIVIKFYRRRHRHKDHNGLDNLDFPVYVFVCI